MHVKLRNGNGVLGILLHRWYSALTYGCRRSSGPMKTAGKLERVFIMMAMKIEGSGIMCLV